MSDCKVCQVLYEYKQIQTLQIMQEVQLKIEQINFDDDFDFLQIEYAKYLICNYHFQP